MRSMVMVGSIITRSPEGSIRMLCLVPVYCSAIRGETLDLMPPVPLCGVRDSSRERRDM
jgi:hypothetical protein